MRQVSTIIVLSLILASCTATERSSSLYAGGPGGLVFSFEDGTPPRIVQDAGQTPIDLLVNVRNTGEYDTPYVRFTLTGINQNDFLGFSPGPHTLDEITGRALVQNQIIEGETRFLELGTTSYARELRSASLDFTVHARACYPYATSATATVCLTDNYYDPSVSCDPNTASIVSSSAPITIRNVQTSPVGPNRLRLSFELEKNGPHRIWAPHASQTCPNDRQKTISEGDYVYVQIDGSGSVVSCTTLRELDRGFDPSGVLNARQQYRPDLSELAATEYGYVRLTQGKARVQCTLTAPSGTDGRGTIDIVAAYYVEDSISTTFTVQRSGMTASPAPSIPPGTPSDVTDGSEHTGTSPTPSPAPTTPSEATLPSEQSGEVKETTVRFRIRDHTGAIFRSVPGTTNHIVLRLANNQVVDQTSYTPGPDGYDSITFDFHENNPAFMMTLSFVTGRPTAFGDIEMGSLAIYGITATRSFRITPGETITKDIDLTRSLTNRLDIRAEGPDGQEITAQADLILVRDREVSEGYSLPSESVSTTTPGSFTNVATGSYEVWVSSKDFDHRMKYTWNPTHNAHNRITARFD